VVCIQELRLINFQSHVDTVIKFSPFFNCIVGSTRSGKSSVVRALNLLFYNEWHEAYQRHNSPYATIIALLSTGALVTRHKGDKVNRIIIKMPDGTIKHFENFGFTLPKEVSEILGVSPIEIGNKDPIFVNVANQDEPQFLFYNAGPDKAKILSRLSGIHWIDYALKDLNADRRTKAAEVDLLKGATSELTERLKGFADIEIYKDIIAVEKDRLSKLKCISEVYKKGSTLSSRIGRWKDEYSRLQELKKINFSTEIGRLEQLIHTTDLLDQLKNKQRMLKNTEESVKNMRIHIQSISESKDKILEEVKNNPVCESCGATIDPTKFDLHED